MKDQFPHLVMVNILQAIYYQSSRARDRFPRLLELIASYEDTQSVFIEKVDRIPCWAFIRWLSQIMAVLNKPEARAIVPLLSKVCLIFFRSLLTFLSDGKCLSSSSLLSI